MVTIGKRMRRACLFVLFICVFCAGCGKNMEWKPVEEQSSVSVDGVKVYTDVQRPLLNSKTVGIIIVNESMEDIAVRECDESAIQKKVDNQWCIPDLGERSRTGVLKYDVLPQGAAMYVMIDVSRLGGGLTAGTYRAELYMYHLDDAQELADEFYMYCDFEV